MFVATVNNVSFPNLLSSNAMLLTISRSIRSCVSTVEYLYLEKAQLLLYRVLLFSVVIAGDFTCRRCVYVCVFMYVYV
jgi:hypothetical protein